MTNTTTTRERSKEKPSALRSIIAGSTAGAIEIGFVAFDTYKTLLQDEAGKISGPRTVVAGFGAGITESLLAVTPFESIKTTLIDDRKSANPRMRGFLHGSSIIWRERGIRGFFQGFVPTTARQAANSATRFGSYTTIKQFVQGYAAPGEKLGTMSTFGIGGLAGLITVYVTQPLDTIKTRMQSIEARAEYKNSFACAARIFRKEGISTFWSGAVPRLVRLTLSGGIVFTIYEKAMEGFDTFNILSSLVILVQLTLLASLYRHAARGGSSSAYIKASIFLSLFNFLPALMVRYPRYPPNRFREIAQSLGKYFALYSVLFLSVVLYLYVPKKHHPTSSATMAWMSSGGSNTALINNLKTHRLITSDRVAQAMLALISKLLVVQVDRAHYAPALPYQDSPQPIGHSATISAPHMHASAAESLLPHLHPTARILDIGSGSGYLTHVLASLVGPEARVTGIDHIPALVALAEANMSKSESGRALLKAGRVKFVCGDGRKGWKEGGPYDAIHVGAAAREEHSGLVEQLKAPGRLFIPVGEGTQWIWVVDKDAEGRVRREKSMAVRYVPLTDAPGE
ncbi:MAG: hypothetical protein Q9220_004458 [cf. Caloplaca sp. 1 TL-2023]